MYTASKHKTAILVFARSSQEEVAHKSIYNGPQLFDTLTNHVLETVAKTELPYFHFSEEKQIGNTFGERFTNAITAIFEKGYEQIITIGNDTPQLKVSHILEAEKQLSSNKSVLGPSTDGGFYLMGLHKSQFDSASFSELAWQTSSVFEQLLKHITQGNTTVFQLPKLSDIDTQADVKSIISYAHGFSEELLSALLQTLESRENGHFINSQKIYQLAFGVQQNKGSPTLLSL
ncbi:TIGR04282 family arsenosugar biosynthesis glycosyltransferase [Maribacter sp. 2308TA10-17]|uniref:TIGR04282 family arsenosugar biosynthesis glycosyltransferase n=1 Tax=Maribacter sp. 2308TA10-17 TaxID=3386276 RepID=UPI0039BC4572